MKTYAIRTGFARPSLLGVRFPRQRQATNHPDVFILRPVPPSIGLLRSPCAPRPRLSARSASSPPSPPHVTSAHFLHREESPTSPSRFASAQSPSPFASSPPPDHFGHLHSALRVVSPQLLSAAASMSSPSPTQQYERSPELSTTTSTSEVVAARTNYGGNALTTNDGSEVCSDDSEVEFIYARYIPRRSKRITEVTRDSDRQMSDDVADEEEEDPALWPPADLKYRRFVTDGNTTLSTSLDLGFCSKKPYDARRGRILHGECDGRIVRHGEQRKETKWCVCTRTSSRDRQSGSVPTWLGNRECRRRG